jgi:hypothetical protein
MKLMQLEHVQSGLKQISYEFSTNFGFACILKSILELIYQNTKVTRL